MPIASARISNELHEKIQIESALAGISVSDFIRSAIDNEVNLIKSESTMQSSQIRRTHSLTTALFCARKGIL